VCSTETHERSRAERAERAERTICPSVKSIQFIYFCLLCRKQTNSNIRVGDGKLHSTKKIERDCGSGTGAKGTDQTRRRRETLNKVWTKGAKKANTGRKKHTACSAVLPVFQS